MSEVELQIVNQFIQKISSEQITKDLKVLICPVGLVGAGKSTTVIPLSKMLKLPRVSSDDVRKVLKESKLNYDNLEAIIIKIAEHFLEQGFGLVIDSDVTLKLPLIEKIKEKYKLKTIFIHINPPEDFVVNKLRNYRGEKWLTSNQEGMVENYFRRKEQHKGIKEKIQFDYEVDTSVSDLTEKIEWIAKNILEKK